MIKNEIPCYLLQILNGLELEATLLRLLSLRVSHLYVRWRGRAMPSVFLWLIQLWLQESDPTKNLLRFRNFSTEAPTQMKQVWCD